MIIFVIANLLLSIMGVGIALLGAFLCVDSVIPKSYPLPYYCLVQEFVVGTIVLLFGLALLRFFRKIGNLIPRTNQRNASPAKKPLWKLHLRHFTMMGLRGLGCVVVLIVAASAILYVHSTWPYRWNLPKGIPLVLGFTTDMGVEDMVEFLHSEYSIGKNAIKVDVIDYQHVFLKKVALRHRLVVKNFSASGIAPKQLDCRFLKNRLMTIIFCPALSEEECVALLGENYDTYKTPLNLSSGADTAESTCDDKLLLVDWYWGTGIHSQLLLKAYDAWLGFR